MRLYTVEVTGNRRLVAEREGVFIDLERADAWLRARGQGRTAAPPLPSDLLSFLRLGEAGRVAAAHVLERVPTEPGIVYKAGDVRLCAPIPRPGKILCAGINFHSHLLENPSAKIPEFPFFFAKLPSVVIGPGDPIRLPRLSQQVDWEVELAVVIGRTASWLSEEEALQAVAGYVVLNDVSARDIQFKDNQITLGKNFDTFAPMGPCLVTSDEVPEPGAVRLRSFVNDQCMQDASTTEWIFPLPFLLSFLSRVMTLEPGDVVSTGTPGGVGVFRSPPVFLRPGDVVVVEAEGIGRVENSVVQG